MSRLAEKYPLLAHPIIETQLRLHIRRAQISESLGEHKDAGRRYENASVAAGFLGKPSADFLSTRAADNLVLAARSEGFVFRPKTGLRFPEARIEPVVGLLRRASDMASPLNPTASDPQRSVDLRHIASELGSVTNGERIARLDMARITVRA